MSQFPAMPMYWADFFSKTDHLSNEEQWAYAKLLGKTWCRNCRWLPDNDGDLARLLNMGLKKWRKIRERIAPFFDLSGGVWRQPHLEEIFREVAEKHAKIVSSARLGGIAKFNKIKQMVLPSAPERQCQPNLSNKSLLQELETPTEPSESQTSIPKAKAFGGEGASDPATDPIKEIFDRGLRILGGDAQKNRKILGQLRKQFGDIAVLSAISASENENPSDAASYLFGCCRQFTQTGEDPHARTKQAYEDIRAGYDPFEGSHRAIRRAKELEANGADLYGRLGGYP